MTTEPELLPCPFCGCDVILLRPHFTGRKELAGYLAECQACGAQMVEREHIRDGATREQCMTYAAEAWNTRAADGDIVNPSKRRDT